MRTPTCWCVPAAGRLGIDLYLKDESTHPTGSVTHRLDAFLRTGELTEP